MGIEELAHVETSIEEIKNAGLAAHYAAYGKDLFPINAGESPFTATYINAVGDPIANLSENMAAEQKARAVYENLIDLTTDPDVIGPLLWLRQREIVHFARFKELYDYYKKNLPIVR